jgi:hypothetical protein
MLLQAFPKASMIAARIGRKQFCGMAGSYSRPAFHVAFCISPVAGVEKQTERSTRAVATFDKMAVSNSVSHAKERENHNLLPTEGDRADPGPADRVAVRSDRQYAQQLSATADLTPYTAEIPKQSI